MANRAMLLACESNEFDINSYSPEEDILAAGSYCIPILWFSMFSQNDLYIKKVEMEDGQIAECPHLVVSSDFAKARIKERKKAFLNVLPRKYSYLYDLWQDLVQHPVNK